MGAIASQIISLTIVYSTVYSDVDQRKHQSSASLAFVWGIHRGPVNTPHKWPVTRKMFPFYDVIMGFFKYCFFFSNPVFLMVIYSALEYICIVLFITQWALHYGDVVMGVVASQITRITIVYSAVHSGADQRKHQRSTSLVFVRGIHRWPVNSPHKWPETRKMFPFDDVIMITQCPRTYSGHAMSEQAVTWPGTQSNENVVMWSNKGWHLHEGDQVWTGKTE